VYDARLPGGARVAVKVRRPDIVRSFKADLAALEWVLRSAEFLTLMRPGVSKTFRSELDLMLLEELDFRIETRYQELFRRYFRRRPHLRTTAPRLCYELCGQDVVVSEFIDGLSVKRLVAAVESGDPCALSRLPFPVDPSVVAKHLVRGSHYGFFECPFFHGDPHPGNILLRPGNRIVLVDFGACGVFAQRERDQLALLHYHHSREDVGGMVQCVIGLMEPLPPIDVDEFRRRLEHAWWKGFYGVKSRHAEWKERTSFPLWSALLNLVRDYRIPLPLNVLRMIRATLLYDTVAARIYARIDVFKEYRRYHEGYARRVKREVQAAVVRQILCGLDQANYVRLAQLWNVGNLLLSRTQLFLQQPAPAFASLVSKGFELVTIAIKFVLLGGALTAVAAAGVWLTWRDGHTGLLALLGRRHVPDVLAALLALVALKYVRQAWFRLDDKDPV
jgi:ubiquinone biosynthesis protein